MLDTLTNALPPGTPPWAGYVVLAAAVGLVAFGAVWVFGRARPGGRALGPGTGDADADAEALAERLRDKAVGRDALQIAPELRRAGYYDPKALARFQAVRALLVLVPLSVTGFLALSADPAYVTRILVYGLAATALGFSLPRVYIGSVARARRREIERGLPVALDLTSLGLVGGQTVQAAFERSAEAIGPTFPVLAEEMRLVLRQAELNTFPLALEQWSERSAIPEVQNVSVAISQADRLGVNVADALMELSTNFRTGLRQRADAQANRASVWMLFPTMICLWIPAGLILAAPVFFEFQDRRVKTREAVRQRGGDGESVPDSFNKYLRRDSNMDMYKARGDLPDADAPAPPPPPPAAGDRPGL